MRTVASFGVYTLLILGCDQAIAEGGITPRDTIDLQQPFGVQLSPGGDDVLVTVKSADFERDRYARDIWLLSSDGEKEAIKLGRDSMSLGGFPSSPQWSPDGTRFVVLVNGDKPDQLKLYSRYGARSSIEAIDHTLTGIVTVTWHPNGRELFVLSSRHYDLSTVSRSEKKRGSVLDKWRLHSNLILGDATFRDLLRTRDLYSVDIETGRAKRLTNDLFINEYVPSPDGRYIAYVGSDRFARNLTAYLLRLDTGETTQLTQRIGGIGFTGKKRPQNLTWSPDSTRLAWLETDLTHRWSSQRSLTLMSLDDFEPRTLLSPAQHELFSPTFHWLSPDAILMEDTSRGQMRLFSIDTETADVNVVGNGDDHYYRTDVSFSGDGKRVAYVRQSTGEPPEVFVSDNGFETEAAVTDFNKSLRDKDVPESREVRWQSADGTDISGRLYLPPDFDDNRQYPLVVIIHGGPGGPVRPQFLTMGVAAAAAGQTQWPYPAHALANDGFLVLRSNYRPYGSYGPDRRMVAPEKIVSSAVEDILSGIDSLVDAGIADGDNVGIMGQSWGAYVVAAVITADKTFKAASFAEGGNTYSTYFLMPGVLNLEVHEYYYGSSPYENTKAYIDSTSVFNLRGVDTAVLYEAGADSAAIGAAEWLTGLWRHGIPHEVVLYPGTGHGHSSPSLELESMERNRDWFNYWMLGKKDPDPAKQEQYRRWEDNATDMIKMREDYPLRNAAAQPR